MLILTIEATEVFDDDTQQFISKPGATIELEHSLASLSKWEAKWEKPFLSNDPKTNEETTDYIRCMTLTDNVDPEVYENLTQDNIDKVSSHIDRKMSATWFTEVEGASRNSREVITSELIYYWMVTFKIPFECQYWHFNRLITLIRVLNNKNAPAKKMSPRETALRNRQLNAERREKYGTSG